jgi:indole-3-acetate monooxygenase
MQSTLIMKRAVLVNAPYLFNHRPVLALLSWEEREMPDPKRSPERARLLDAVNQIAPLLESAAPEAEEIRHLPQRAVDAMLQADLFRCAAPREVGGLEVDPLTQTEIFEAVTAVESNAGWNLMIGAIWDSMIGARLPDEGAQTVFNGDGWPITAGLIWPFGQATSNSEGGFSLTGRWKFGSGIHQASWVASGCAILDGDTPRTAPNGMPVTMVAVVPRSHVTVHDNWHTSGLRGTGSCDYSLENEPLAEALTCHSVSPGAGPVEWGTRGGAWWRLPAPFQAGPGHGGFALGIAKRCLDEVKAIGSRRRYLNPSTQAERESVQLALGRHMMEYEAARLLIMNRLADIVDQAERGEMPPPIPTPHTTFATEVAVRCAEFAYRVMGGNAVFESSPVQRYLRDVLTAQQHIAQGSDGTYARYGKAALDAAAEA